MEATNPISLVMEIVQARFYYCPYQTLNLIDDSSKVLAAHRNIDSPSNISEAAVEKGKAASGCLRKYAAAVVNYTSLTKIYGLEQCTPDISKLDYGKCLDVAMNSITIHASGQLGASMVRYSCVLRFETYKFFQPMADAPAPPASQSPPPLSTDTSGDSSNKSRTIITTTASAVLIMVLLCLFLRLRKRKHNINVE
ncbi:hypothetical protein RJ639_010946, partial [Escallonia herrerae]